MTVWIRDKLFKRPRAIPVGFDFLELAARQEDACEATTASRIRHLGKQAPACFENLGTVLSLLDRVGSCFWGCRGGDHILEALAGRVCSSSRAALRLLQFGFYDESLSLSRSIGEIANLLLLFNQEAEAFREWQQLDEQRRKRRFSPAAVRLHLEKIERDKSIDLHLLTVDRQQYGALSEVATHPTPQTKPQVHNPLEAPCLGGVFQEAGVVVALQELAEATARATIPLPKLLGYDDSRRDEIRQAAAVLLSSVGPLKILNERELFAAMRMRRQEEERPKE